MPHLKLSIFVLLLAYICLTNGVFICEDSSSIPKSQLCDGKSDCEDGSDETSRMCFHLICPKDKFRCQYGGCMDKTGRCNGTVECHDGSDENFCSLGDRCKENEFKCLIDGICISENIVCDGEHNCTDGSDENQELCQSRRCPNGTFRCRHGGCIYDDLLCDGYSDCPDASDEMESVCDYVKCKEEQECSRGYPSCKPIDSKGLDVVCVSKQFGHVSCNRSIPVETTAKFECKEYYLPSSYSNSEAQCQPDGNWNGNILKCKPECGKRDAAAETLIVYGRSITNWPWHAVMYMLQDGEWKAACGGTLILENVVLTAAHCTWKKSPSYLKFAFAKYHSDFNVTDDFTQFRDVRQIITRPEYLDYRSNYGSDIAVVILSKPIQFSEYIKPACLDWNLTNLHQHLAHNTSGRIAGMGLTEDDHASKTLKALDLPVVSTSLCIKNQKRDFKKYVTYTAFCAGWANGTSVCNGDSGGGLLFRDVNNPDRWILQGLVSVSPRRKGSKLCDTSRYAIFTKVSLYLDWLKDIIKFAYTE